MLIPETEIFSRTNFYNINKARNTVFTIADNQEKGERTMRIGMISDTHDNLPTIEKAIKKLNEENVELALHAGDYVSPFVIPKFRNLKAKLIGVFGNNDGDHDFLRKRFSENRNLEIRGSFAEIVIDNLKIALLHGSETELLESLIESSSFNIVVHGHSHKAGVQRKGAMLVINPGEVCGYLSGKSTIALFDSSKCEARIVEL